MPRSILDRGQNTAVTICSLVRHNSVCNLETRTVWFVIVVQLLHIGIFLWYTTERLYCWSDVDDRIHSNHNDGIYYTEICNSYSCLHVRKTS